MSTIRVPCRRRRASGGMTLLEILLALVILALGVVGILAIFPAALQSSTESVEETMSAMVAESVSAGLVAAFRSGVANANSQIECTLTHDLRSENEGIRGRYTFILPPIPPSPVNPLDQYWHHYPGLPSPPTMSPDPGVKLAAGGYAPDEDPRLFKLAGDGWSRETHKRIKDVNDESDPYDQFAFSFDIRKVHTMQHLVGRKKPDGIQTYSDKDFNEMCRLYEVRIHLFRTSGKDYRRLITTVTKRISSR
jgi:type II secretory pathway pseudopilin PulG